MLVDDAAAFVSDAYNRGGRPWRCVEHARCVGELLRELHCSDTVVAAGMLHDLLTDECATATELRELFGERVGDLVCCLTEDPAITDYGERQRALRQAAREGGLSTMLILAADALARMQAIDDEGLPVASVTLMHYQQTVRMLVAAGVRSAHVDELHARLRLRRKDATEEHPQSRPRHDRHAQTSARFGG